MSPIEIIIGAGICALLWKIQRELGKLSTALGYLKDKVDDHEERIRIVER